MTVKYFQKHPFEFVLLIILLYAVLFSSWRDPGFINKITGALALFSLVIMVRFAWPNQTDRLRSSVFPSSVRTEKNTRKFIIFAILGIVFTAIEAVLELFVYLILKGKYPVVVGFPYSIYSFSADRILWYKFSLDALLNASVIYIISDHLKRMQD